MNDFDALSQYVHQVQVLSKTTDIFNGHHPGNDWEKFSLEIYVKGLQSRAVNRVWGWWGWTLESAS